MDFVELFQNSDQWLQPLNGEIQVSVRTRTPQRIEILLVLEHRQLVLTLFYQGSAVTYLDKKEPLQLKVAGTTTRLYSMAKQIMQKAANLTNNPVRYSFLTREWNLYKWSQTKGNEIFHWSNDFMHDDCCETVIHPDRTTQEDHTPAPPPSSTQ